MIAKSIQYEGISNLCMMLGVALLFVWLAGCGIVRKYSLPHDISYGVYLWGWLVEQLVGYFMPWLHYWSFIVISLLCTFSIAYISCVFVEEPGQKLCKKVCSYMGRC